MATIKTAIALYDGVTSSLKSMHKTINTVIGSFERMRRASAHAVDVGAIQAARGELARMRAVFDSNKQTIYAADQQQQRLNQSMQSGSNAATGLWSKVNGSANGAIQNLKKLVGLSDDITSVKARLSLIVDDGGSVSELEQKIMASAQRSRAPYLATAQTISQMGLMAGDVFAGNDELIAFAETLNKQFAIAGMDATESQAAALQLTQAMASGVLRGEDLDNALGQAPNAIESIAEYMAAPVDKITSIADEGQITASIVKNAILSAANDVNAQFKAMPMTWAQVFTQAKNIALQMLLPLLNGINWLTNHISLIGPAVLGLGAAFLVFQVAAHWTEIAAAAAAIYHSIVGLLTIGFGILTGNTSAASAAVFTYNSALLANPIVWVVMLIMVLIGALYAGVAAYNKFAGAGVSATGIIGGAFAVLGAFLLNTFIVPILNAFSMIANFLGNVFHHPVAAVKVLFYDMCLTVVGYISTLAHAIENMINHIPGITLDITSGLDNFYAALEEAQQKVKDEAGWMEYAHMIDFMDYSDAASAGYQFGKGIADKVSGMLNPGDGESFAPGKTFDGIYGYTGDIANNTAAANDALEIAEEDLAYLRDIAEREAINRFTTAEIKVEQTNHNTIAAAADLDGIMDAWANDFAEKLEVSEEGVHL